MLRDELVEIFRQTNPELYDTIARLVVVGEPKAKIEAAINAAVNRTKTPANPQRGELTRSGALLALDWMMEHDSDIWERPGE